MREMSSEMATLLKSKKMVGDNRPAHEVVLGGGKLNNVSFIESEDAVTKRTGYNAEGFIVQVSNYVVGTDGKEFCTILNTITKEVYIGRMDNNEDYFTIDFPIKNVIPTGIYVNNVDDIGDGKHITLFRMSNGKILMLVLKKFSIGVPCTIDCYVSNNGLGTDFAILSNVHTGVIPNENVNLSNSTDFHLSLIREDSKGNLYFSALIDVEFQGVYFANRHAIFKTNDNGFSWDKVSYYSAFYGAVNVSSPTILNNGEIIFSITMGSTQTKFVYSKNNGATWDMSYNMHLKYDNLDLYSKSIVGTDFWETDTYYDKNSDILYRWMPFARCIAVMYNPTIDKILSNNQFDDIWNLAHAFYDYNFGNTPTGYIDMNYNGRIILEDSYSQDMTIGIEFDSIKLQAKSITINRNNGMSSNLNIEFDNKNGILAPDKEGNYFQALWPNKEIVVRQGYGNELTQTYKGLIDSIDMGTFPQSIIISARDNLKKALDQTITTILDEHVLTFVGMQVEDMFVSLANMAGIPLGIVEETGIAVAEKTFSWETYGDAFSWLSELVGFEVICDEEGLTHFRKQQIPTEPTISYEFTEGEDIVSLGYTINDSDLYREIIVHGKTTVLVDEKETDEVIEFKKVFSAADYWGILPQKILKIDAPEATTLLECEQIALKAEYLMISRARIVRFQSIGIPHLQVGDFIRVTESSSTISEVYRITDLSTNQDSDTYTMYITCHWYSAGGAE